MVKIRLIALLLIIVTVCGQTQALLAEATICPFDIPDGADVTCHTVTVPESRGTDSRRSLQLLVAFVKSSSQNPAAEPLIYLHGGPGGRSLESLDFLLQAFEPFLQHYNMIFFDQRGVGYSGALDCPAYSDFGYEILPQNLEPADVERQANAILLKCRDQYVADGVDLKAYTTAASAADVRDIAAALGYDKVNLLGASYGTRLALTVMRDDPQIVRSVILDAVLPLQVSPNLEILANTNLVFDTLFDGCAQDSSCNDTFPDLKTVFYDTVDRLNETPELVSAFDPYTGQQRDILVDGNLLISSLFDLLYQSPEIMNLPRYIYDARDGAYDAFIRDAFFGLYDGASFDEGDYVAIECNEEIPFDRPEALTTLGEDMPQSLVDYYMPDIQGSLDLCQAWDDAAPDPKENEPVSSDLPALVTVGQYDPITVPRWAHMAAETLSHSYFYQLPGLGHVTLAGSQCAVSIMVDFLTDPTQAPDSGCIELDVAAAFCPGRCDLNQYPTLP